MKFYNRDKELASLEKVRRVSFSVHSQMTVLTGRRRIGKTSLIFKSCEDTPTVYLFVSRSNETDLCLRFTAERSDRHLIFMYRNLPILQKYSVS